MANIDIDGKRVYSDPDLALRRKVAEREGWTIADATYPDGGLMGVAPHGLGKVSRIPAYELDIAAAWGLLGKTRHNVRTDESGDSYWCMIWDESADVCHNAPTAPYAICLAYIAWKEQQ